jgi:predicted hydrocarbon binding protein/KaiC/GvpD/RAD55 family RecA-like ATPase
MEKRGLSLAEIQEVPNGSLILLAGPPGAGKSTFCHQVVLNNIVAEKPIIFITTEQSPSGVTKRLKERGIGESVTLSFVDAFTETVGLTCSQREDTVCANCADLNSLSIATTRLQERIGQKGILLALDSLTSPYLFSGAEVTKFMRLFLSRFAAEGNSVMALMDEGCSKPEDMAAMMSIADGVIRVEIKEDRQLINVMKHAKIKPVKMEVTVEAKPTIKTTWYYEPMVMKKFMQSLFKEGKVALRGEVGDTVNLFWPNLAHWSGMLWDPKGFPTMIYELNKEEGSLAHEVMPYFPWQQRLLIKSLLSLSALRISIHDFNKVGDMKTFARFGGAGVRSANLERSGDIEYLSEFSKDGEHHFRVYENSDCWGLENAGTTIASHLPPLMAGQMKGFDRYGRDWNAIETKCIGLGDPYCEFKLVPGEIGGLRDSLEKDSSVVQQIHGRLIQRFIGFLLKGEPLIERPRLGNEVHIHVAMHAMGLPHLGERYRMAQRMGGAKTGKEIGEHLITAGLREDEALKRVIDFMEYCNVGKVTLSETIKIQDNCESIRTKLFSTIREPSCFFTTGFLNGLFSAVKNQHAREIKCITAGDPYCEWEII